MNARETTLIQTRIRKLNAFISSQMTVKKRERDQRGLADAKQSIKTLREWAK